VVVEQIPEGETLSEMLESGAIDALYAGHTPSCVLQRKPSVRRLFPSYREEEQAYFRKAGVFPIGHTVVIRADVLERHPWVARSLYTAFDEAKRCMYKDLDEVAVLKYALPWLTEAYEEVVELFGAEDWWQYGIEPNRVTIETFLRYCREQGIVSRALTPEDLFASSLHSTWKK